MKNVNWDNIQIFYNDNHTWKDIIKEFNISSNSIAIAVKKNKLKTRSISESNILANIKNPRKLSEETKKKISDGRKKYLIENPDQVPYLLNHYSKGPSYPEKYFNEILKKTNLKYEKYLQISIYNLDFAFVNKGIDLEIDGNQHYDDERIVKSNKERDIFLRNKGWKVIRIRWSFYKSMKRKNKEEYIRKLIEHLNNENNEIPSLISNKKYCKCGKEISNRSEMCIKCFHKKIESKKGPPLEIILKELSNSNYTNLGKKYGVSATTIKKWIINSGGFLPKPKLSESKKTILKSSDLIKKTIILYNENEFNEAKSNDKLKLECIICHKEFLKSKHDIKLILKAHHHPL